MSPATPPISRRLRHHSLTRDTMNSLTRLFLRSNVDPLRFFLAASSLLWAVLLARPGSARSGVAGEPALAAIRFLTAQGYLSVSETRPPGSGGIRLSFAIKKLLRNHCE